MMRSWVTSGFSRLSDMPLWLYGVVFLASRVLLALGLYLLVGGAEFTNDTQMWIGAAEHWALAPIGAWEDGGPHPPWLGAAIAVLFLPLRAMMPDFLALRFTLGGWEAVMAICVVLLARRCLADAADRGWVMIGLLALPLGWMTSVVMAQDEVVGASFIAAALLLFASGRRLAALIVASVGLVAGKIFVALAGGLLVTQAADRPWSLRLLSVAGPALFALGLASVGGLLAATGGRSIVDFAPAAIYGINLWALANEFIALPADIVKWVSAAIAVALMVPALLAVWSVVPSARSMPVPAMGQPNGGGGADGLEDLGWGRLLSALAAVYAALYVGFYHVQPEYLMLSYGAMLLATRDLFARISLVLLSGSVWAINFFEGIHDRIRIDENPGKSTFIAIYEAIFPVDPRIPQYLCILITVALLLVLYRIFLRQAVMQR